MSSRSDGRGVDWAPGPGAAPGPDGASGANGVSAANGASAANGISAANGRSRDGGSPSDARRPRLGRARDWAELLRISALFTVPGDALAGAAAIGVRPNAHTLAAIGSSLCLYEAGMALNDWADHDEDAVDRPHRPLPSGRIPPGAALAAAGVLTATGLGLAARAGRPALTVASLLAGSVWAYDLKLKHTAAGPAAMATARGLDLLLGAVASGAVAERAMTSAAVASGVGAEVGAGTGARTGAGVGVGGAGTRAGVTADAVRRALPSSAVLAAHTLAVTTVSRREAQGGSALTPLAALAATTLLGRVVASPGGPNAVRLPGPAAIRLPGPATVRLAPHHLLGAAYVATAARPLWHAALNPSPQLTQRAVGGGIRAMIPLQSALAARAGSLGTALATAALAPLARRLGKRVSAT
ncbi:UbiA family prenyltransferase [Streptomyces sp. LHD-70]|uniref:SCO3242 family prenyltransferase n=1 Tax=Streptomyces sp. LHD-70 TaxID=3072140 RepID=UPI00280E862F|nr:UbiA family prenyltransferase [Streptomyces sp. LHD-70]MDQ8706314.1 UbiA family prenyltransferase [Streptomyces sp. LHD-70]